MVFNCLDNDNGIVYDQSDREHKAKQRERIYGETKKRKDNKCSYQRDWHGQKRN